MRKTGRVEIQAEALGFGPGNPVREMLRPDLIPIHSLARKLSIAGVQIQAMLAGNEGERLVDVCAEFVNRARAARIIARYGQPAAQGSVKMLEAPALVTLPAVEW